jgi:uncharacterized protein (TIGR03086 family)
VSIENYKSATEAMQGVLAKVDRSELTKPTPCAEWDVSGLINHAVGGQYFFASVMEGKAPEGDAYDAAKGTYLEDFVAGAQRATAAFAAPGALDVMYDLPFGTLPGSAFLQIATTDVFVHAWDLAKATGQPTDLDRPLASTCLAHAKSNIPDAVRNEQGNPFGPQQTAPANAKPADELAAFLGRTV